MSQGKTAKQSDKAVTEAEEPSAQDRIRAAIFAKNVFQTKVVTAFGVEMEIRQPSLGEMLALQKMADTDDPEEHVKAVLLSVVKYCYVPGTNDPIFNESDLDLLKNLPFDDNIGVINDAVAKLTDVDVSSAEKN